MVDERRDRPLIGGRSRSPPVGEGGDVDYNFIQCDADRGEFCGTSWPPPYEGVVALSHCEGGW